MRTAYRTRQTTVAPRQQDLDRRTQRTQKALGEALYALITERPYDLITVQDVADRANVARSSFYAHYCDKDDLMFSGFLGISTDASGRLFDPVPDAGQAFPSFARWVMASADQNRPVARALLTPGTPSVAAQHLRNLLVTQIRDWLRVHHAGPHQTDAVEMAAQFISSALMGVLVWWVHCDFPTPADRISAEFDRLAWQGLGHLDRTASGAVPAA